ncbi:MAG: hypothetical protein IAF58_08195 [Leptolyngbya sp.]|nr:hypothetical protein [Candidatus Melainabacteria bacterium]
MSSKVEICPEVARLAQRKTRAIGSSLTNELARLVAEQAILELDPELNLLIEGASTLSEIDALIVAAGVNGISVNGREIDIRPINEDGMVAVPRVLVGTPYLSAGVLVVAMSTSVGGQVVGHVGAGSFLAQEDKSAQDDFVYVTVNLDPAFDLGKTLVAVANAPQIDFGQGLKTLPDELELARFLTDRQQIIAARQKQIVTAIVSKASVREALLRVADATPWTKMTRILADCAVWEARTVQFAKRLNDKFPSLKRERVIEEIRKAGEEYGGQPDAPEFRREIIKRITKLEVENRLKGSAPAKVQALIDAVIGGQNVKDVVNSMVSNKAAVAVASAIKDQRNALTGFCQASGEEIGMAFGKLALQPAYATHSFNPETGVAAINEALELLEVGHIAEIAEELDMELASS